MSHKKLNDIVLANLYAERNLALAKRLANTRANLPTDRIDERIAVLDSAIEIAKDMINDDANS